MIRCDINRFMESVNERAVEGYSHFYEPTYVNAYENGRGYGGPEEGGWWYDYLEPLNGLRVSNKAQALQVYDLLLEMHGPMYDDDREISSVIHEGDLVIYLEEHEAKHYPETRPHYE